MNKYLKLLTEKFEDETVTVSQTELKNIENLDELTDCLNLITVIQNSEELIKQFSTEFNRLNR